MIFGYLETWKGQNWIIGESETWVRGVWMDLSEWLQSLKAIMSYLNAPHRSSTAEDVFRLTELYILWILVGFFIQSLFFLFFAQFIYGSHNGKGGDYLWKGYPHVCPSPMLNYLVTAKFLICQLQTSSELWYGFILWGHQTITWWQVYYDGLLPASRNRAPSSLE